MSFPIDKFSSVTFEQVDDVRTSSERYNRNKARGNRDSYFSLAITSPPYAYSEFMPLWAKIVSYESELENFLLANPLPALAVRSGHTTAATANEGSKAIIINTTQVYQAGDFIQFVGHSKAYLIANVVSGATQALTLTSPLIEDVPISTSVLYGADVNFNVCLRDAVTATIQANNGKFTAIDAELIEQA